MLERAEYDRFRVAPLDPATVRNRDVDRIVHELADRSGGKLKVEKFAESLEGRPIFLLTLGKGPRRVLLWSQMHGDEPTHTSVMLDLFSYLLQRPTLPRAEEILSGCTLLFIPMLNPDGAEAVQRYNAQGIDINRDWRRLATPEGRTLLRAAKELQPQFGFNLHNQNARTTVGRPPKPAAISVLAPAPDSTRKVPPSMLVAKQMSACFVEAVEPYARGMISRYDDTHEPRAFGDGIQSLGVSTMLAEAGGWTDPDPEPLTRLHFHGMLATLSAIATDQVSKLDHQIYEALPESNSSRMDDYMISKANVLDAKVSEPYVADIVIDQVLSERLASVATRRGKITEVGDLPAGPSRVTVRGEHSLLLPGQVAFLKTWKPGVSLPEGQIDELLSRGTTTVIGQVDLSDRDAAESIESVKSLPMNWGFIGTSEKLATLKPREIWERLAAAAASGILAVASAGANEELWRSISQLGLPLIKPEQLAAAAPKSYVEAARAPWTIASALKQPMKRGRITRDYAADLMFFSYEHVQQVAAPVDWKKLTRVMVAGEVVWENGKRASGLPGVIVRRV